MIDFRNLDDPNDISFKPHPTDYPVAELEYPNNGAVERCVRQCNGISQTQERRTDSYFRFILLAPKDKDHYNPIMDLEKSLYTIVECKLSFFSSHL